MFVLFPVTEVSAQGGGWKVWVKTSPCSGLHDWVSVAQKNPTEGGGGSFWYSADYVVGDPSLSCTHSWSDCTFAAANAEKEIVRTSGIASGQFANYCCREYSVWEHGETGKLSIVQGKQLYTSNYPWRLVKPDLCCLEAEAMTGLTGACSGSGTHGTGTLGGGQAIFIGCFKDTSAFDLDGHLERSQSNTPQRCVEICKQKGFAYAAVQYGESCLCGNSYGKYGAADNCNYPCTGDSSQACGGYNANSVYSTGGSTTGSTTTTEKSSNCWDCITEERYCRQECYMTGEYGVSPSFGNDCAPQGFGAQCYPCWQAKCKGTIY
jgi:hypothetical protein